MQQLVCTWKIFTGYELLLFNAWPRQNGRHFEEDIYKFIFMYLFLKA